jgi:hypothetical protein
MVEIMWDCLYATLPSDDDDMLDKWLDLATTACGTLGRTLMESTSCLRFIPSDRQRSADPRAGIRAILLGLGLLELKMQDGDGTRLWIARRSGFPSPYLVV